MKGNQNGRESMDCDRYWFLTWSTYGTWLPGDPRGNVTSVKDGPGPRHRNNGPGTPNDHDVPGLRDSIQTRKSYASRRLNSQWQRPASKTWWTESGSKRKLKNEDAILATAKYIRDQEFPLAVYVRPEFANELPPQVYSDMPQGAHAPARLDDSCPTIPITRRHSPVG
jgi:hypothetical protein